MIGPMTEPPMPKRARTAAAGKPASRKPVKRKPADPARAWARRLARTRPGLVGFVMEAIAMRYGPPVGARVHEPTPARVLTILSQNSADTNAEQAFEGLRARFPGVLVSVVDPASDRDARINRPGWGGAGLQAQAATPDWAAMEQAPLSELVDAIRSGGLAQQKAPRIQAALRTIRELRGDYSLEFLGDMSALAARDWLTAIDGVGRKTASVVLLFSFGTPLMPVDRHVERVSKRIGLMPPKASADEGHEQWLAMLEPDQMYAAHVGIISHGRQTCHARNPLCDACPIAPRCRYIDRRAP